MYERQEAAVRVLPGGRVLAARIVRRGSCGGRRRGPRRSSRPSPAAIACIITLPMRRGFDRSGQHAALAGVGDGLAELRDSAFRRRRCGSFRSGLRQALSRPSSTRRLFSARLSRRAADHGAPRSPARPDRSRRQKVADGLGHVAGSEERSRRRDRSATPAAERPPTVASVLPSRGLARPGSRPAALLHQPQPGDVLQQADRAAHAPFVGEIQPRHSSLTTGRGVSIPIRHQVPELM